MRSLIRHGSLTNDNRMASLIPCHSLGDGNDAQCGNVSQIVL